MDRNEILRWLRETDEAKLEALWARADETRRRAVGDDVHLRGLIEVSNHCIRSCAYCGIAACAPKVPRYRMDADEILACADKAKAFGFGTVVMQAGEDPGIGGDWMANVIRRIKARTGLAITLSLGERDEADLRAWREAGADRYLLRFETSDPVLHARLRAGVGLDRRLEALCDLRGLGYQLGSGYMVGLPGETEETRISNALLCAELRLDMVGIGPFIPHPDTPLAGSRQEPIALALRATALVRLLLPDAHMPATTAAGSLDPEGREKMILAGANVLMPNITPPAAKRKYLLYPGKICLEEEGETCIGCLSLRMKSVGRELSFLRGDALRLAASALPLGEGLPNA